jgi:putative mRNA 3-end processing factor
MAAAPLLTFTDKGIYCPHGDFFIDPWRPVDRAVITHAHSDHARSGHRHYLSTPGTDAVMRHRLGAINGQVQGFGVPLAMGGVTVSFHAAGHVPGSAMIRVERGGEVWVVSGDYKVAPDGLSEPWEPVPCHTFISECTFGLPVFRWQSNDVAMAQIKAWWQANAAQGVTSIIGAYALGKAQRLIAGLAAIGVGPILCHTAVEATNAALRAAGYDLPETVLAGAGFDAHAHVGAIVIAPPAALGSAWAARFGARDEASASGWMALRGVRRQRGATGFVISDHADWPGLNMAIREMGAQNVFVTHGYTAQMRRWLAAEGYNAGIVATEFAADGAEPDHDPMVTA